MAGVVFGWLIVALACGARTELDAQRVAGGGGNVGAGPGQGGDGGVVLPQGGNAPECVVFDSNAALAPLDLFIMLDSSGSMDFQLPGGQTKWQAVRNAFQAFANDPESAQIGIGLGFFPIIDPSEPSICNAVSQPCGNPNNCKPINVCPSNFSVCDTDQDCVDAGFPQDECVPYGVCQNATAFACLPTEPTWNCNAMVGPCIQAGSCWDHFTCESGPYQNMAFGVADLPGAASGFINAIDTKIPDGATPTLPALQGAVQRAITWGDQNPSHTAVVVLATDGLPTVCDQALDGPDPAQAIQNLASVAANADAQGVQVWVIGVFTAEEQMEAQLNLDTIAAAGGTTSAFVIDTGGQVTEEFTEAMNQVRMNAKSCEFELVPSGDPIVWTDVWVRITSDMGDEVWIARVDGAAQCSAGSPGFYYDTPVGQGQIPNRIILCPSACALINDDPGQVIEVFSTCDDPPDP